MRMQVGWDGALTGIPSAQLAHWASVRPDDPFLACGGDWLSFGVLEDKASRLAAALADLGIMRGQRVAVILPNRDEIVLLLFANLIGGYVSVPLNTYLRGEYLRFQMVDSAASVAVVDGAGMVELASIVGECAELRHVIAVDWCDESAAGILAVRPDLTLHRFSDLLEAPRKATPAVADSADIAAILYTSGTTGLPKGCLISHGYMGNRLVPYTNAGWMKPDDVILTPMPLFHGGAMLCICMPALQGGIPACFDPGFSVSGFTTRLREVGATFTQFPGPMAVAVLGTPEGPQDRDHCLERCATSPLRPDQQIQFEARFGVKVLTRIYGQTEMVPVTIGPHVETMDDRTDSGFAVAGVEVVVRDDEGAACPTGTAGEIVILSKSPDNLFSGYWGKDPLGKEGDKLVHATGDMGRLGENGSLTYVGRKKDSMRRRGENVSAYELERSISLFPGITNVAVHAVQSELGEDEIKACIVESVAGCVDPAALFAFLAKNVPYFAIPRFVERMTELPANAMGRVMKETLCARGIGEAWDFEQMGLTVAKAARRSSAAKAPSG